MTIIFGTHKLKSEHIALALKAGYPMLDTATGYNNASEIKKAIDETKIVPKILTKFNPSDFKEEFSQVALKHCQELGQIPEIVLIHSPLESDEQNLKAFMELRKYFSDSLTGVSNFSIAQIQYLLDNGAEIHHVSMEFSPFYQPNKLLAFCNEQKIPVSSYRATSKGAIFTDPTIKTIADKYKVSPSSIVLRWLGYKDIDVIISSTNPVNIRNNFLESILDLTVEDNVKLNALHKGESGSTCMLKYCKHD